jgi:beta-lactamase regulating signal transducer with metallopeptidase domain
MNVLTEALLWCSVQVTVLAVAALCIDVIVGGRRPAARSVIVTSALVAVVGLSATALCPLPSWRINWDVVFGHRPTNAAGTTSAVAPILDTRAFPHKFAAEHASPKQSAGADESARWFLENAWTQVIDHWAIIAGTLYLIGSSGMALRIVLGLTTVRAYRRNSRPIADRRLLELANGLRAELGCVRAVALRESSSLRTPATVGWGRPIILLPMDWPNWTDLERRAVIAHEMEHVRRRDFPCWIIAQLSMALHFYHPLVHLLAARLRLQQELSADAAAARAVGGQRAYVTTLAAMALRQSDALVAWPARAFLPSSNTFLRRIEMLHTSQSLRSDVSRPILFAGIAAVAVTAVCAAGFRNSAAAAGASAAVSEVEQPAAPQAKDLEKKYFENLKRLRLLALAVANHYWNSRLPPSVIIGPGGTPHSWRVELLPFLGEKALYDQYRMDQPWDSPANKKVLERMPDVFRSPFDDPKSTNTAYFALVGPGTLFEGQKGIQLSNIPDGSGDTILFVEAKRNIPWTKPEDIPFDPNKPVPEVGGFVEGQFSAAFADAHAARMRTDKIKDQLKWLIMRNDGHPIKWPKKVWE